VAKSENGLSVLSDASLGRLRSCLAVAQKEGVQVLILPELSLALPGASRDNFLQELADAATKSKMIIFAGSYYDQERYSRLVVVGPGWIEKGYKIRPSRFEASPAAGVGMRPGLELLLLETPYGRIVPITCVDLISDSIQYQVRDLADRSQIDVLINLNYNPASWEFLIEANSIARRHPLFVTITNISIWPPSAAHCGQDGDDGSCGGNTALFASLRPRKDDCPDCEQLVVPSLPAYFKEGVKRSIPYDTLAAVVPPLTEALLVYDLNLRLLREPAATNAPDQGYPTVRNLHQVPVP